MINNIKSQMHRKPTFDKIIYKALLPFNEVKYPDREATILRRSHKLTKYDEVQFLGLQRDTEAIQKSQIQQANTLAAAAPKAAAPAPIRSSPGLTAETLTLSTGSFKPQKEASRFDDKLMNTPGDIKIQREKIKREIYERKKEEEQKLLLFVNENQRLLSTLSPFKKELLRGLEDSVNQGKLAGHLEEAKKESKERQAASKIQNIFRKDIKGKKEMEKQIAEEENKLLKIKVEEQSPTTQVMSISSPRTSKKTKERSSSRNPKESSAAASSRGRSTSRAPKASSAPAASSGELPEKPQKDEVKGSTGEQTEEQKERARRRTAEEIKQDREKEQQEKMKVNTELPENDPFANIHEEIVKLISLVTKSNVKKEELEAILKTYTTNIQYRELTQIKRRVARSDNYRVYQKLVVKYMDLQKLKTQQAKK